MKKPIFLWQFAGFSLTALLGTLLHFVYDWSGNSIIAAPFSAVNESIFEHMKLLFFPLLLFAFIESRFLQSTYPQFWCVKLISITASITFIPMLYYSYTGAFGVYADWFNITIFFIADLVAYALAYWLFQNELSHRCHPHLSLALLLSIGIVMVLLTFYPPQFPLFRDPLTNTYGYQG